MKRTTAQGRRASRKRTAKELIVVKEPIIAGRLRELQAASGRASVRAFASYCGGVNYRRLDQWLKGENAPDAENLRRIARATDTSVDWLLGIDGAPMMRQQSRAEAPLLDDVIAHVTRVITQEYPPEALDLPTRCRWVMRRSAVWPTIVAAFRPSAEHQSAVTRERARAIHTMSRILDAMAEQPAGAYYPGIAEHWLATSDQPASGKRSTVDTLANLLEREIRTMLEAHPDLDDDAIVLVPEDGVAPGSNAPLDDDDRSEPDPFPRRRRLRVLPPSSPSGA